MMGAMAEPTAEPTAEPPLPEELEERVLAILDGDDAARDGSLRGLFAAVPQHVPALRAWLVSAGIAVPDLPAAPGAAPGSTSPAPDGLPRTIGQFRLVALLGRGGFGTVYRAEQLAPIQRAVAVKVLNPGMNSREVLARFAAEQQALNRMDHPGIARLIDAGSTPEGQPFFVMELVEGPPLAKFCRQRGLPLRARLELFLHVLDAMQHAHQKAVLHRDLSSNNVLVADPDGRPQPKIIDFGIAKSLGDPLLQGGAMTFQGTLMGTAEFMSPEQAAGRIEDLDTRADVYALGVQLYELLTDRLPILGVELRAQGLTGMAAVIARTAVPQPSQVAPRERQGPLRGDLDAITLKALAKARDERYASVAEFAADLRRHLADEPVAVAMPTTWLRLRKFVRRHRAQSIAASVGAAGLLAAFVALALALRIAHDARDAAEQQRQAIAAKADQGFRLLANEDTLRAAIATAERLPPPWPEHEAALRTWLDERGELLAAELPKLRRSLARLDGVLTATPTGTFADPADHHLHRALQRLEQDLLAFLAPSGPLQRVRNQLRCLTERMRPAQEQYAAAWTQVQRAVRDSDGRTAHRGYHGLLLPTLPGLVPLGFDPHTQLAEFLDLASHPPGAPPPQRGGDGRLLVPNDCGAVFVLVPPGMPRLGAVRGQPGLPQDDPHAADDELRGQLVNLDEFLIARTEATQAQWARWNDNGSGTAPPDQPATGIAWSEARTVLQRFDLDLPTEAQWEYACRAGSTTPWFTGATPADAARAGWFEAVPTVVARRLANGFGLFDTHGNVAEWCRDDYLPYADTVARAGDGLRLGPALPTLPSKVVRGGACQQGVLAARASARAARPAEYRDASTGLRPIRRLRRS
jgi:serine/threonine protein kinase